MPLSPFELLRRLFHQTPAQEIHEDCRLLEHEKPFSGMGHSTFGDAMYVFCVLRLIMSIGLLKEKNVRE